MGRYPGIRIQGACFTTSNRTTTHKKRPPIKHTPQHFYTYTDPPNTHPNTHTKHTPNTHPTKALDKNWSLTCTHIYTNKKTHTPNTHPTTGKQRECRWDVDGDAVKRHLLSKGLPVDAERVHPDTDRDTRYHTNKPPKHSSKTLRINRLNTPHKTPP